MSSYTQNDRPLLVKTPLGPDVLLIKGLSGEEAISQPFKFRLDLLAERKSKVSFDLIMGQNVTVEMKLLTGEKRYFNGLVKEFRQGGRDADFVTYTAEIVPNLWLLTKTVRSRTFQHITAPDILKAVFAGLVVTYEFTETYFERDYCVQYRESDFDFASRLMEEEGIRYFFKHADGSHQMVVTDDVSKHPPVPGPLAVPYEDVVGENRRDMRILKWEKAQQIRSSEYTLWDHCFEMPSSHLEAKDKIMDRVPVGKVTHRLDVGNAQLEIYDYPGCYAQRFDGIDKAGSPRPADLQRIFTDRARTIRIRMEQEESSSLSIEGEGDCGHFTSGHEFKLERHFDANGKYLLKSVQHHASQTGYRSGEIEFNYENRFVAIPEALRFRPARATSKPVIGGVQTATVVGPPGEEIFVDKYGRVKVQFHWDREGKMNGDSSCWVRVSQVWAGKGWGAYFWPRVGHEVVVTFEEGDPDQPMIVGSVYNAENMPWFQLPLHKNLGGFKSASFSGTAHQNYNGIVFNDEKGHEHLSIHSERNLSLNSENDKVFHAGRHKGERVSVASVSTIGNLPGGGGSGGGGYEGLPLVLFGGGSGGDGTDLAHPKPWPQGILGLNSTMVYGENIQTTVGVNHQLTVGSNFQMCINPVGLLCGASESLPHLQAFTEVLGSGLGGNMQLTVGTNAAVIYGRNIEIDAGMPKLELHGGTPEEDAVSYKLVTALGAVALAYVVAYSIFDGDAERANITIAFQVCADVLLSLIMAVEMVKHQADKELEEKFKEFWSEIKVVNWDEKELMSDPGTGTQAGYYSPSATAFCEAIAVIAGAAVAPLVVVAQHEKDAENAGASSGGH
jgi:type VI secretion system secreted protein VgrG